MNVRRLQVSFPPDRPELQLSGQRHHRTGPAVDRHQRADQGTQRLQDLQEAVTEFVGRAAEKLRRQESLAGQLLVFIHTSPFRRQDRQYARSITVPLRRPTADTLHLADVAITALQAIYRPGYNYAKAGVMLLDLQDQAVEQGELDLDEPGADRGRLMAAVDAINRRHGRGAVHAAGAGTAGDRRESAMRQQRRTPHYTTDWQQLPIARA